MALCYIGAVRHRFLINQALLGPEAPCQCCNVFDTYMDFNHSGETCNDFPCVNGFGNFTEIWDEKTTIPHRGAPIGQMILGPSSFPLEEGGGLAMWFFPGVYSISDPFPDEPGTQFIRMEYGDGNPILFEPDVWHTFEMKASVDAFSGGLAQVWIRPKLGSGVEVGPIDVNLHHPTYNRPDGCGCRGGLQIAGLSRKAYGHLIDDVEYSNVDWVSDGGTVVFEQDFEITIGTWSVNNSSFETPGCGNNRIVDPLDAGNHCGRFADGAGTLGEFFLGGDNQCPEPPPAPFPATPKANVGILGCGIYEIQILTRGGRHLVHTLPYTDLEWGRVLDDTSEATLTIAGLAGRGDGCCAKIADIRPWKHELSILRNGDQVWVGPIVKPSADSETAVIQARDLSAWWDKRFIHHTYDYGVVDLAFLFAQFAYDAMQPDNSPGIHVIATECQILGEHKVLRADHRIAGEELRSLSQIGVDWTVFNREIIAGGVVIPLTELPAMYDSHFIEPPTVTLDGLTQENLTGVRGPGIGADGDAIFGYATDGPSARENGLLEGIVSQETAGTGLVAQAAAQSRLALVKDAVGIIEEGTLAYASPFPINDLVAGRVVPVRLNDTCYPVDGFFRVGNVKVRATASEGAITETVNVGFMPLGTTFRRHHYPPRQIITPGSGLP